MCHVTDVRVEASKTVQKDKDKLGTWFLCFVGILGSTTKKIPREGEAAGLGGFVYI